MNLNSRKIHATNCFYYICSTWNTDLSGSSGCVSRSRRIVPRATQPEKGFSSRSLAALGNPEKSLPCVVHVAGTNGKGSFVAFLKAICEAAGYVVHSYTSPHLVRFAERISVAFNLSVG